MKTGRYSLKELLTHNEIEQIIIPEIQRDYVWTENNVKKLIDDIIKGHKKKESHQLEIKINGVAEKNESVHQFLKKEYERLKYHQKLGFIYAYHDRDYAGKFFLIDGQQRITTLFLMLLNLYKTTNKVEVFRALYFNQYLPKVDYKVREQSHDFLKLLIECELNNTDYKKSEYFYASEYQKDITIRHLIKNYNLISAKFNEITDKNSFLEYLEDFVEVNYFDTHLSEQGEQLYIYMNSRGEQLSFQEIVRAELMQKISEPAKKIELGKTWENWQNFFWQNRGSNENADKGFEEFLKWATIIHIATHENIELDNFVNSDKKLSQKELKENYIKQFPDEVTKRNQQESLFKYQRKHLDFEFLNKLFSVLEWSYTNKTQYIPVLKDWLNSKTNLLDYIVLLPLLQYQMQNEWTSDDERILFIERVAMFLKNITYFEGVSKSPDSATLNAIYLVSQLKGDKKDILHLKDADTSKSILTDAEISKIDRLFNVGAERRKWEQFIWNITLDDKFNNFLMGDISVLLKCLDKEKAADNDIEIFTVLEEYLQILKKVIHENKDSDKLRRLLLAKFDYLLHRGTGASLEKYSFIGNGYSWEVLKEWAETMDKNEFTDLLQWTNKQQNRNIDELLKTSVTSFSLNNWREAFVKYPALLAYCINRKILWQSENRILLLKQTNYSDSSSIEIQYALLKECFRGKSMWIWENECCVLDFDLNKDTTELEFKGQGNKGFALDIVYTPKDQKWSFTLLHGDRKKSITDLIRLEGNQKWKIQGDRFTYVDETIYDYDENISLLKNNEEICTKVYELLEDVKNLLISVHIT
jgi:uncharacterized protein with ParB-like and HNH nuclease domain